MKALVVNDIAGRFGCLEAAVARGGEQGCGAIFVLGNLVPYDSHDPSLYVQAIATLAAPGLPVYLIPGQHDSSWADLNNAIQSYRGPTRVHLIHRAAAWLGPDMVVAGFGGRIIAAGDPGGNLRFPEGEVRTAFQHLASSLPAFQLAPRRIFLFAMPPERDPADPETRPAPGAAMISWLARVYQPDLICCAGRAEAPGVETLAGSRVLNPGSLAQGSYAVVDLEHAVAHVEHLPGSEATEHVPLRSIVVPLDESEESERALGLAATLARATGARLTLVHAFAPIHPRLGEVSFEETIEEHMRPGERLLARAAAHVADLPHEEELLEGPPATAILRVAETHAADLIVMGAHEARALPLLGRISQRILREAPCPVLITRA